MDGVMGESRRRQRKIYFVFIIILIFFILSLSGCQKENRSEMLPGEKKSSSSVNETDNFVLPLKVKEGRFFSAFGWIHNNVFVYVTESSAGAAVFAYDLKKGESRLLHKTKAPIVSLTISPSREYIFIHSSPSANQATATVIDTKGKEIFTAHIPSMDITVAWNPYNERYISLAAFTETWDYTGYLMDLHKKSLTETYLPQPFVYWLDEQEVLFLDWNYSDIEHFAPLKKYRFSDGTSELVMDDVYYADVLGEDGFLFLLVRENTHATYNFYTTNLEKIRSFRIPHLSNFSDWLIPYYDYVEGGKRFLTFQPFRSGEADLYDGKFQLVSYSVDKNGEEEIILEKAENEPISCSPDGKYCLYGFYMEKLLNVQTKEIVPLLEQEYDEPSPVTDMAEQ